MDLIIDLCGKFAERSDVGLQEDRFVIIQSADEFFEHFLAERVIDLFRTEMSFLQQYAYIFKDTGIPYPGIVIVFIPPLGLEMNKKAGYGEAQYYGYKTFIHNDVGDFLHHVNVAQYRAFVIAVNVAISIMFC
jgi:hypothetical protein